jgi:hypothetical protein
MLLHARARTKNLKFVAIQTEARACQQEAVLTEGDSVSVAPSAQPTKSRRCLTVALMQPVFFSTLREGKIAHEPLCKIQRRRATTEQMLQAVTKGGFK